MDTVDTLIPLGRSTSPADQPPTEHPLAEQPLAEQPLERIEAYLCQQAANLTAAEHQWLRALAEFDRRRGWEPWECRSCAEWLAWHVGLDIRAAREKVRVAHKLDEFPSISAEMATGHLSYSKVRAISRIATPANEQDLVDLAIAATTSQVEAIVSGYRRATPPDQASASAEADADSPDSARRNAPAPPPSHWLRRSTNDDHSVTITLRLPAEAATAFLSAVETFLPDPQPTDTLASRRADAAVAMAEYAVGHRGCSSLDADGAQRYLVVLHTDGNDMCEIEGHGHSSGHPLGVSASEALRILCDADIDVMVHGGEAIGMSARRGLVGGRLRRFILNRDRHCQFPGCTQRAGVDIHHIIHREHGGSNDTDNLITLCRFHHHRIHDHGWRLERTPRGVLFHAPDGRVLERSAPPAEGDPAAVAQHARTESDGRSKWDGSPLHLGWVVAGLIDRVSRSRTR